MDSQQHCHREQATHFLCRVSHTAHHFDITSVTQAHLPPDPRSFPSPHPHDSSDTPTSTNTPHPLTNRTLHRATFPAESRVRISLLLGRILYSFKHDPPGMVAKGCTVLSIMSISVTSSSSLLVGSSSSLQLSCMGYAHIER